MRTLWSDSQATEFQHRYREYGEDLALRVYTSRLIGADPDLVLHGGGSTSLKSKARDLLGEEVEVLHIDGIGLDLESIEPDGLPAVRLAHLLRLRGLSTLDDERLVAEQRRALLDPSAPSPSFETLLHAFLPHRYIDHSHADVILALTNQPDAEACVRQLFSERVAFVPYAMPGFELARRAADLFEKSPDVEGLVLEKHGLLSFGEDARTSYERHVGFVEEAERFIRSQIQDRRFLDARPVMAIRDAEEVAPLVRGALAEPTGNRDQPFRRWILEHRSSDEILEFAAAEAARRLASSPPIAPDHVVRTKGPYLLLTDPPYGDLRALGDLLRGKVEAYRAAYREYFERNVREKETRPTPVDPTPRIVILPGLGLFACGPTRREAWIAADIAEHTVRTKGWAEMIGRYEGISEGDLFELEYRSLVQAEREARSSPPLEGQVALLSGGAGAIGEGVARSLVAAGAHVVLVDVDLKRLEGVKSRIGSTACEIVEADVTDDRDIRHAFGEAARLFGGVDVVVTTAGVAERGELAELESGTFERTLRVNVTGTFLTVREALRGMELQGTGGHVVIVSSKTALAPERALGANSASEAGAGQVGRIAAVEGAPRGVRVNMVNVDAVFGSAENPSGFWETVGPDQAAMHGIAPEELPEFYRRRNLLRAQVTPDHVGKAVLFFVTQQTPTTGAVLRVDGGLPEAFPR